MRRSRLNASVISWLRCFEAAARASSFTQAAAELFLTQGAVSQQVRELEDRLGMPLFRRLPRQLQLTDEGRQLRDAATRAFDELELALSRVQDRRAEGPVSLSCYSSFALLWLMPRIGDFYRRHPGIDLRVSAEFHALEMATLVRDGIDAAVRYDLGGYRDLEEVPLLDEYLLPVASPSFLSEHPKLRNAGDLDGSMLLHDSLAWSGAAPEAEWRAWGDASGVKIHGLEHGRRFNLSQLAIAAALDGQGVAIGRVALVLDHLREGSLLPLFGRAVRSPAAYRLVHLAQPHSRVGDLSGWLRCQCDSFAAQRDEMLPAMVDMQR